MKGPDAAPAKAGKNRGDTTESAQREPANGQPPGGQPPPNSPPAQPFGSSGDRAGAAARPRRSLRELKNWRVRSRLILLVLIPTLTAVLLGGIRIGSSLSSALAYQRVEQLANLSGKITGLVQALQNEREDTVEFIVLGTNGGRQAALSPKTATAGSPPTSYELQKLQQDYGISTGWANQVSSLLGGVGSSYSALAQQEAQSVATAIGGLSALRAEATGTRLPTLVVIQQYANTINTLLALDNQVAVGSNDSTLAATARVVGLVSAIKEEASEQQAILTSTLDDNLVGVQPGQFGPSQQTAITDAEAEQQGNQAEFNTAATAAQRALFNGALSASAVARAQAQEQAAISLASSGSPIATDPTVVDATTSQYYVVSSLRSAEQNLAGSVIARSTALRNDAITSAIIWSIAVLLVLVATLIFMTIIGRSMVRPLRKLRAGALEVAGQRLPETVRRMSETDGEGVPLEVEPIDVDSSDEIGEVARAFDQVHREALRLAANEAALRGNVNAMFVNLSRRSQSLIERQIRLIDDLEQGEQDPERLSSLFQMDHLATRMRRNSENLLVLAGHEESRRWNQPLALVDVLRASLSEIEHYERVTLNVQPGIVVRGQVVSDVVHLTAELVENATSFSGAQTPVTIAGHLLSSGGALLEITDQGVGMGAEEMAHANWRLDNPPVVDVAVSRRMGLFVVARLAARHGIRVRLRSADPVGLIALVWLPDEVITRESPDSPLRLRPDPVAPISLVPESVGGDDWEGSERFAVERELSAARTPRFASPRPEAGEAPEADDTNPDLRPTPVPSWVPGATQVAEPVADGDEHDVADSPARVAVLPDGTAEENRLPIFEAVESDWFRRGGQAVDRFGRSGDGWASPADEGWRAAEVVYAPSSAGITSAGLPKRVPQANLIPGAATASVAGEPSSVPSARSAAATRDRFASFQRGVRHGRAVVSGDDPGDGEDETSG